MDVFKKITQDTCDRRHFVDRSLSYYQNMYKIFGDKLKTLVCKLDLNLYIDELKSERKELERKAIKQTVKPNPQGEPKKMESAGVKFKGKEEDEKSNPTDNANEKLDSQNSIEENQRRATRALARFKKAYSKQNKDEDNKETGNKIQSLAAILQEHIMKPLAEMAQEGTMRPRGGSVECRGIKTKGVVELLENVPVVKKMLKNLKISILSRHNYYIKIN